MLSSTCSTLASPTASAAGPFHQCPGTLHCPPLALLRLPAHTSHRSCLPCFGSKVLSQSRTLGDIQHSQSHSQHFLHPRAHALPHPPPTNTFFFLGGDFGAQTPSLSRASSRQSSRPTGQSSAATPRCERPQQRRATFATPTRINFRLASSARGGTLERGEAFSRCLRYDGSSEGYKIRGGIWIGGVGVLL